LISSWSWKLPSQLRASLPATPPEGVGVGVGVGVALTDRAESSTSMDRAESRKPLQQGDRP
jgi:hypothetical protein